jgi:hypothetical protein
MKQIHKVGLTHSDNRSEAVATPALAYNQHVKDVIISFGTESEVAHLKI